MTFTLWLEGRAGITQVESRQVVLKEKGKDCVRVQR